MENKLRRILWETLEEYNLEEKKVDQDKDGDNDFDDVKIARMKASGMSHDTAVKKVHETIRKAEDAILDAKSLVEEINAAEVLESLDKKTYRTIRNRGRKRG